MSDLRKKFNKIVSRQMLEKNEQLITTNLSAEPQEIEAIKDVLNAVVIDFYLPEVGKYMHHTAQRWDKVEEINAIVEEKMRDFPKSLSCFKIWVVKNIGIEVLSEPGSEMLPYYDKAREILYLNWYEREGSRMTQTSS